MIHIVILLPVLAIAQTLGPLQQFSNTVPNTVQTIDPTTVNNYDHCMDLQSPATNQPAVRIYWTLQQDRIDLMISVIFRLR
jgi:hypothetical protein